jgi:hypothetical protein
VNFCKIRLILRLGGNLVQCNKKIVLRPPSPRFNRASDNLSVGSRSLSKMDNHVVAVLFLFFFEFPQALFGGFLTLEGILLVLNGVLLALGGCLHPFAL